jgi:hypothetical protein
MEVGRRSGNTHGNWQLEYHKVTVIRDRQGVK